MLDNTNRSKNSSTESPLLVGLDLCNPSFNNDYFKQKATAKREEKEFVSCETNPESTGNQNPCQDSSYKKSNTSEAAVAKGTRSDVTRDEPSHGDSDNKPASQVLSELLSRPGGLEALKNDPEAKKLFKSIIESEYAKGGSKALAAVQDSAAPMQQDKTLAEEFARGGENAVNNLLKKASQDKHGYHIYMSTQTDKDMTILVADPDELHVFTIPKAAGARLKGAQSQESFKVNGTTSETREGKSNNADVQDDKQVVAKPASNELSRFLSRSGLEAVMKNDPKAVEEFNSIIQKEYGKGGDNKLQGLLRDFRNTPGLENILSGDRGTLRDIFYKLPTVFHSGGELAVQQLLPGSEQPQGYSLSLSNQAPKRDEMRFEIKGVNGESRQLSVPKLRATDSKAWTEWTAWINKLYK